MSKLVLTTIAGGSVDLGPIPFNLYAKGQDGRMILFCRSTFPITPRHKKALDRSDRIFYISSEEIDKYLEYSFERIERIVANDDIRLGDKTRIVWGVGKKVVRNLMDEPRSGEVVGNSRRFVDSQIELIMRTPEAAAHLFSLSAADPHMLTHSLNVCTFCVLLGEALYGQSRTELQQLGLGGLLHDIGKTQLDQGVFAKKTPLTDRDWDEIRRHPELSKELMSGHGLSGPALEIGKSHHERVNGMGYPDGLRGGKIHPFARIAAVADIYDNITSNRDGKNSLTHMQALAAMAKKKERFDQKVFDALLKTVIHNEKLIKEFKKRQFR